MKNNTNKPLSQIRNMWLSHLEGKSIDITMKLIKTTETVETFCLKHCIQTHKKRKYKKQLNINCITTNSG
jgi:hypothetical protein